MTASQPGTFNVQEFTDLGDLAVGGRIYTFVQGTTTFKTAYTDAAGLVPHTYTNDGLGGQYIGLNARGELPAPLYLTTGAYDIRYNRADGSLVWTREADPAGAIGLTSNPDFPTSYAGAALKRLRVNAAATAVEFIADTFLTLQDSAIGTFVGKALQVLRINALGTAIESAVISFVQTFLALTDLSPQSYVGKAGQSVVVNGSETGITFDGYPVGDGTFTLSGGQPVIAATDTTLLFASTEYSQLKRGTFAAGVYIAGAAGARISVAMSVSVAALAAGGAGSLDAWLEKNSATRISTGFDFNFASGTPIKGYAPVPAKDITLAAGETVRGRVNCGSNQTIDGAAANTWLSITELA